MHLLILLLELADGLLFLISIDVHLLEVVLYWNVFALPEIEYACLLLIHSSHHPPLVVDIIMNFF